MEMHLKLVTAGPGEQAGGGRLEARRERGLAHEAPGGHLTRLVRRRPDALRRLYGQRSPCLAGGTHPRRCIRLKLAIVDVHSYYLCLCPFARLLFLTLSFRWFTEKNKVKI